MLIYKFLKLNILTIFLIFLLSFNAYAKEEFYKCPEKIMNVIKSEGQFIKAGAILGVNYVKFSGLNSPFQTITVKFKKLVTKQRLKKLLLIKN